MRVVAFLVVRDGAAHGGAAAALDETGGWSSRRVRALGAARNDNGLGLGELDGNVVFFGAGDLAVQLIAFLGLLYVEARGEGRQLPAGAALAVGGDFAGVAIEVIEETEERCEGCLGGDVGS